MCSRYISCAIIGGLIGFAGQFLADHASPKGLTRFTGSPSEVIITTSNIPSGLSGDTPYSFVYYANGRSVGTPYNLLDGTPAYPGLPQDVPKSIEPTAAQKSQWQQLWYQLVILDWLQIRGAAGVCTAGISAGLGMLLVLLTDRLLENRSRRKAGDHSQSACASPQQSGV